MRKTIKLTSVLLVLALLFSGCFLTGCGGEGSQSQDNAGQYTITIASEGGKGMEGLLVRVYSDATKSDITAAGRTDDKGQITFESQNAMGHVVYIEEVPTGYQAEASYTITAKDTVISLKTKLLSMSEINGVNFRLGDVFVDFEIQATDGNTYRLSSLLEEKKAVVINFWYVGCEPCKNEFPFMQSAYEVYKDQIEVIAIDPYSGRDNIAIKEYQENLGLTFPMAQGEEIWQVALNLTAYPCTVIIDRYGTIGYMHTGAIVEAATFEKLFAFFTAEDYKQTTIRNASELNQYYILRKERTKE